MTVPGSLRAVMSICDVASAVCVALNIDGENIWSTAESTTCFLYPIRDAATATETPIKLGKSLPTVKIEVHDDAGKLRAYTTQMVYVATPAQLKSAMDRETV